MASDLLATRVAATSLHRLRARLLAAGPGVAADIMQEAGFATGEALTATWREQLVRRTGIGETDRLDAHWFGPILSEVCETLGWGQLAATPIGDRGLLLSASAWHESEPGATDHPGCYFTCGCFAAFLTAQAGAPLAVLEVECRSAGNEHCRFLAGSAETLAAVYDLVAAGGNWAEAFPELGVRR